MFLEYGLSQLIHKTPHAQWLSSTLKRIYPMWHVIFRNMSNNKNNQITDYKTDSITTNDLSLLANHKS